ncbi:MAG TPA: hypothetical protein VK348_12165, partial [Planctomycetota bacterium]|nr:hypothetical protein [Planctomycetota bacterium]
NNGISFVPQFQDAYSISIGDLALAPSAPDTLYVGTGEANNQRSSYWGNGVHKSIDGGKTWTHLGLEGTEHIGRIVVHPQNADIVFVAALGALYSANEQRGLFRSKDGGKTWERIKHLGKDIGFVDLVIDPVHPDVLYAASYERRRRAWNFTEGGEGSRIWKSTDGGNTWDKLAGGLPAGTLGRIGLDLCLADPRIVYATIENLNPASPEAAEPARIDTADDGEKEKKEPEAGREKDGETLADPLAAADELAEQAEAQDPERRPRQKIQGGEVWRSDDAGGTWKKQNGKTAIGGNPGYYYGQIHCDPVDPNTVYVLSVQCYKSTDGGKSWGRQGRGQAADFARGLHSDHHALWLDPDDGNHVILGNDGGLAVTFDGGQNWDHQARLPIAQYYTLAVDTRSNYRIYGGLQDNGTWGLPIRGQTGAGIGAADAFRINGGDGFCCAVDPGDPDVVYSESQFGAVSRRNLHTGDTRGIKPRADKGSPALRSNWMSPILLSPHDGHTVYFGTQYLHRSRDRGNTWSTVSPDLTTNDADKQKGNVPHCTITTIAESPRQEGRLWVGTDDGKVWTSKDGGCRWQDLTATFPPEVRNLWVSRVEASPHDVDTCFVAFSGYREDLRKPLLFRTDDGGETFRPIQNDLPNEPINVVRQHPHNAHVLLVGTEMGAYVSVDDGGNWAALGKGLPRVAVHDLLVHDKTNQVIVGTHGRGIWVLDGSALVDFSDEVLASAFHVFPPSDGALLRRAFNGGSVGARNWSVANPFTAPTFHYYLREDGEPKAKIEVLDAAGKVLWTGEGSDKAGYHTISWGQRQGGAPGGPGGQRQGGQGGGDFAGFFGGRGGGAVRPGQFAVRISHGDQSKILAFTVQDLRGPRSVLGDVPGLGSAGPAEQLVEEQDEEALEAEAAEREAEEAAERAGEQAGQAEQQGRGNR